MLAKDKEYLERLKKLMGHGVTFSTVIKVLAHLGVDNRAFIAHHGVQSHYRSCDLLTYIEDSSHV